MYTLFSALLGAVVTVINLQLPVQSVPIIAKFVSSNPAHVLDTTYFLFIIDLRQVDGFLRVLRFPPTIKLTATTYLKYVESDVKHHKPINGLFTMWEIFPGLHIFD